MFGAACRYRTHMQTARPIPGNLSPIPTRSVARSSRSGGLPRLVAASVAVAGLITLLSAALAPVRGTSELWSNAIPLAVRAGAASVAAVAGFGLLIIAGALARRQRRAWGVAIVLLVIAGAGHLVKDVDIPAAAVNLGLAGVL